MIESIYYTWPDSSLFELSRNVSSDIFYCSESKILWIYLNQAFPEPEGGIF